MGGSITLRALLALGDEVRGASIWSSASYPEEALPLGQIVTPVNIHHSSGDSSTPFDGSRAIDERLGETNASFYQYAGNDHLFQGDQLQQAIDRDVLFFKKIIDKE
jgi:dienelactone hydrolase